MEEEKKDKLPTPKELMKMVGVEQYSVAYQESRVILNNLDKPVVAYGVGYAGFVCIIKTCQNFLKGYTYSVKHIHCRYPDGGFAEITLEKVQEVIKNNMFLIKKGFDEEVLNNGKIRPNYLNQRPVIATIKYKCKNRYDKNSNWDSSYEHSENFRLVRIKSGKIRAETYETWRNKFTRCDIDDFIKNCEVEEGIENVRDYDGNITKEEKKVYNLEKNVPDEILQEAKDQILVKDI